MCHQSNYTPEMIRSFRHRGLKEIYLRGSSSRVRQDLQKRIIRRLDILAAACCLDDLNLPGFDFHRLRGKPTRYSIHINGPFCITFEWSDIDCWRVDLEQYH